MLTAFDRIFIDVPSLLDAVAQYSLLLGPATGETTTTARWILANVTVELREVAGLDATRIHGLSLLDDSLQAGAINPVPESVRGIALYRCGPDSTDQSAAVPGRLTAVDHLVLQSANADACIGLFRDKLGLRLALDQEVPEWGGRMLFFRFGKMTLEVIHNLKEPPPEDIFWGITYLCGDIDRAEADLTSRGIAHSPVRTGRKPGTRVLTVKSHCLGLPTLLIGPA